MIPTSLLLLTAMAGVAGLLILAQIAIMMGDQ